MSKGKPHHGETAVRLRSGVDRPGIGSAMFGPGIETGHADFLAGRRMVVIGAPGADGSVWATILTGPEGFARAVGDTEIAIAARPVAGDPLHDAFRDQRPCGLIALDPLQQRRIRANGVLRENGEGLVLRTEQVLRNCGKYIQKREAVAETAPAAVSSTTGSELTSAQQDWIGSADTFFVASHSPEHGADVSHRGGHPGLVTVSKGRLSWPDYAGNSFFMTFGNLELNPLCGLLFLNWEAGNTLHLSGECHVDWHAGHRTAHFDVRRVVQIDNATTLRWRLLEFSSFNP